MEARAGLLGARRLDFSGVMMIEALAVADNKTNWRC